MFSLTVPAAFLLQTWRYSCLSQTLHSLAIVANQLGQKNVQNTHSRSETERKSDITREITIV